jgi:hypothetical protein
VRVRRRHRLGEDDSTTGLGTAWVDDVIGSRMARGAQCHGLREDKVVAGIGMASLAWGWRLRGRWHHCSGRGRWRHVNGLDCGRERWCRGSGVDSTTAWRLRVGLDDGAGSREIFGGKFW